MPIEGIAKLHSDPNSSSLCQFPFLQNAYASIGYVILQKRKLALRSPNLAREASFAIPSILWLFLLFLSSCAFSQEYISSFIPPKGWEAVEQDALSRQVKIAFIKKEVKEGFCPSLNLVEEQISGNLNDYLNSVKAIHEQNRTNRWRKLGKVQTASGEADLTEIDTTTPFGPVRLLQLFLLKEQCVYIITAAALKKDIPRFYADFQKSFHSLTLEPKAFEKGLNILP